MDSRSDKAGDDGRAQCLFDAISGLLALSLRNGLPETIDIHLGYGAGGIPARCRIQTNWDDAGAVMVSRESPARGQASTARKAGMGTSAVTECKHFWSPTDLANADTLKCCFCGIERAAVPTTEGRSECICPTCGIRHGGGGAAGDF